MTGSILLPRKLLLCIICVAVALGPWPNVALALPGITPPPELIYEIQPRLRKGQAEALVLVQDALIEQLHTFKSAAGLTHLRFIFTIGPESHSAIMFEPDWTAEERYLLESGRASLVGIWETFQGKPSFTTKLVFGVREPATPDAEVKELLEVHAQRIAEVNTFLTPDGYNHLRFDFSVSGYVETFSGLVPEGVWTRDMAQQLSSGTATLIGVWQEDAQQPTFIVHQLR